MGSGQRPRGITNRKPGSRVELDVTEGVHGGEYECTHKRLGHKVGEDMASRVMYGPSGGTSYLRVT